MKWRGGEGEEEVAVGREEGRGSVEVGVTGLAGEGRTWSVGEMGTTTEAGPRGAMERETMNAGRGIREEVGEEKEDNELEEVVEVVEAAV